MDSPHLLPLGLLLLALAAPHANIAMSTVGTAERIEDYSTEVTVYRCRDCNSCTCKSGANDFETFGNITYSQNEMFSYGIRCFLTNETHTTVCFEKKYLCPEGVYRIFWRRDGGSGLSCGTLSSGENGRGDISTEKTICCEAETDTRRYNPEVKCFYSQLPRPRLTTPTAATPGNGEGHTSETNSIGLLIGIAVCTCINMLLLIGGWIVWAINSHRLQLRWFCQAHSQDTQAPEGENIPLNGEPFERRDHSMPAASSSSSQDAQQHLNAD